MRKYLIVITLIISNYLFGQTKKTISDSAKFNKYVSENSTSFVFDGQKPQGEGWTILEKQFELNQFVAWGEYHNSALFSRLSNYALGIAAKNGFKNWCIETSPFVASELMRIAKTKKPYDSIAAISKDHPSYGTFPFFKTREDVQMTITATEKNYNIWGIDQEFQLAFPYCISKAYQSLHPKTQTQYKAVHDSLLAKWWMPDAVLLDSLKKVVSKKNLKAALEDIKISKSIYNNSDNLLRATLMKKNFYHYYDSTASRNEKVFFKMGANHLAKGVNLMTHTYDIGNAAYELSQHNQTGFANVYFINRYYIEDGKTIDDLESDDNEYPKEFFRLYDKDKWIVVDIRKFRNRYRNDKTLTDDTYNVIDKYDFIVVSPEVKQ